MWAQRVLPNDQRVREMNEIARAMSREVLEEITRIWLAGIEAGEQGDIEASAFIKGTFGPWATQIMQARRS